MRDAGDPEVIIEETYSPTSPAVALLAEVVPTIPPVDGLNVKLVAVATPNVGVINVGEVANTTFPVPVGVPSPKFTNAFPAVVAPVPPLATVTG